MGSFFRKPIKIDNDDLTKSLIEKNLNERIIYLEDKIDNQPKYTEKCRWESGGTISTYDSQGNRVKKSAPKVKTCKMVRIKSQKELNSEGLGWAIGKMFD